MEQIVPAFTKRINEGFLLHIQIGGTYASPVISPPQVAIGALGKIQVRFFH